MREALRQEVGDYQMYQARRAEFSTADTVPFHVSDEPLGLSPEQHDDLQHLSVELSAFMTAADQLYHTDEEAAGLLNRGKPEIFQQNRPARQPFIRPDLIITEDGFAVCEIETSPFGLGLAHALNTAYRAEGHETIVNGELRHHLDDVLPDRGSLVYSAKTEAYRGQLGYAVERLFAADGRDWQLREATEAAADEGSGTEGGIYRAFYLHEYETDPAVRELIERGETAGGDWTPSLTPHLEEKALMAFLWDDRWEAYFRRELGDASYEYLQSVVPPTWIVGEEEHFMPGLPGGVADTEDIAGLSRSKRALVLKSSGYDHHGSWAESVELLHQKSGAEAGRLLVGAAARNDGLQIVQEFRRGVKMPMSYTEDGITRTDEVRVRLTPYVDPATGRVIAAKATGRSGTDFIHAATDSVNAAVGVR